MDVMRVPGRTTRLMSKGGAIAALDSIAETFIRITNAWSWT